MKSAHEITIEVREKWSNMVAIYAESLDACFEIFMPKDEDIISRIQEQASNNQINPVQLNINRDIVSALVFEHCFKDRFWRGPNQIRRYEVDLKSSLENWPFPDNPENNFMVYVLQNSERYQAFKTRYKEAGYVFEEMVFPGGITINIGLSAKKLIV